MGRSRFQKLQYANLSKITNKPRETHNNKGELLITGEQQMKLMELDDEWEKINNFDDVTFDEAEKLIKTSEENALKRKRMGYASTAQLRLIERKTGIKQSRLMKSAEARKIIVEIGKLY